MASGLKLKIDSSYFFDKFVEDTVFIDEILSSVYTSLTENPYVLGRTDYLRSLFKTKIRFISFLEYLLYSPGSFSDLAAPLSDKFKEMISNHKAGIDSIQNLLSDSKEEVQQDLVSEEEISFLLKEDTEE